MSDKGDVYVCRWEKNAEGDFVGWLKKKPSLRAEGLFQSDMVEELADIVGEHYDDHEACLEFEPPLSAVEGKVDLFRDGIVSIAWNSSYRFPRSMDALFSGGKCVKCGHGIGSRSNVPLIVESFWGGSDGAFSWQEKGDLQSHLIIVSEGFLRLLNRKDRRPFEARPVAMPVQSRRKFFEIIPKSFIPKVSIKGRAVNGWRCSSCENRSFGIRGMELGTHVVCRSDLPSPIPNCFFVGCPDRFSLCMNAARFREIFGRSRPGKMLSNPLAIVDENHCVRRPWLPTLEQNGAYRKRYGLVAIDFKKMKRLIHSMKTEKPQERDG
jgi:hypothetical protein